MNEILKMIETVSPDDRGRLDEIDARVWCYVHNEKYAGMVGKNHRFEADDGKSYRVGSSENEWLSSAPQYTRSRDALASIRPKDWNWYGGKDGDKYFFKMGACHSGKLPTETLAELHAIIQAIEYERNK